MRAAMGEVRVKAKLTNAGDEALVRRGMLEPERVRTVEADAFVDTGATRTVLPAQIASRLGLSITAHLVTQYADGRKEAIGLTEPLYVELAGRKTVDDALVVGDEVLIGQTVLERLDLSVDCNGRRVLPNHGDQIVNRV
jgi:predicted aspartyl protease